MGIRDISALCYLNYQGGVTWEVRRLISGGSEMFIQKLIQANNK